MMLKKTTPYHIGWLLASRSAINRVKGKRLLAAATPKNQELAKIEGRKLREKYRNLGSHETATRLASHPNHEVFL